MKRAPRLQELLFYVTKRSLVEGSERVLEQEIGSQVFGRPEAYDTAYDNIVRTNVSDLRKRIELYFNSEGRDEKLIVVLPRGSYVPVFKARSQEPENLKDALRDKEPALPEPHTPLRQSPPDIHPLRHIPASWTAVAIFILVLSVGSSLLFWSRYRTLHRAIYGWQQQPALSDLWSRILTAGPETDIVLSDDSTALAQTVSERTIPLKDYLNRGYLSQLQSDDLSPDKQAAVNRILSWNLESPEESALTRRILLLDPLNTHIHIYNARFYMADLIRRDNVILIGARKSNPWAELFEGHINFVLDFSDGVAVENRSPIPGEQKAYAQTDTDHYCVVAFLPNPEHNGNVLLIEGTNAEATEAAGDFLLSEDQLSSFKRSLHVKTLPYFEALLKVSSIRGTPFTATLEAYRTYTNP